MEYLECQSLKAYCQASDNPSYRRHTDDRLPARERTASVTLARALLF